MDMTNMFSLFEVGLGAYLLYGALTQKGQMYKNDNIKKGMEEKYRKLMRLFGFTLGPMMLALGVVDYFSANNASLKTLMLVLWGLTMAGIVLMFVLTLRMTDRAKAKSGSGASARQKGAPRAAFEFEEDTTKDGSAPAEQNKK